MRRFHFSLLAPLLALLLAGCFASRDPLIGSDAVFPYQKIVFTSAGETDQMTLVRNGDSYALTTGGQHLLFRFKPVRDNFYVVQIGSADDANSGWLMALLKVDMASGVVLGYKMVAGDHDEGPGLVRCDADTICVDSLDAYVKVAMAAVDAGTPPDNNYQIVSKQ